jgi:hypothetical protein
MQTVLYGPTGLPLNPQTPAIVDPSAAAIRTSLKALEYAYPGIVGGHYRVALPLTGGITTSIGANSPLVAFRWAPTTAGLLAVVKKISAQFGVKTVGSSAAIIVAMDVIRATGFTVQDTAGAAVTFNLTQKARSTMGNSQAAIQYANGTVALTAGTRTLDSNAFGATLIDEQPAAGVVRSLPVVELYKEDSQGVHPLVLANNEGFIIRNIAAWTSTAFVCDVFVVIEWAETLQF